MSKKFDMDIIDNAVTIEVNLPMEECEIINNQLMKGIEYWRLAAFRNLDQTLHVECENQAPKKVRLISKRKKYSSKDIDIETILAELTGKYIPQFPKVERYIKDPPNRNKVKCFSELKTQLIQYGKYVKETENLFLKNVCLLGQWLTLGYKVYRYDKLVKRNKQLPLRFEKWILDNCGITKTMLYKYRNFAKLVCNAPKLIHCRVGLNYFVQHHDTLMTYFKDNESIWKHQLVCDCDSCKTFK